MKINTLAPSPNSKDRLIEGYSIAIDRKQFHIFVMEELTGTRRGYILKLMLGWGNDTTVNLQKQKKLFPQATELMNRYLPNAWINNGKTRHCYKYIVFGHGDQNKNLALNLLHAIVDEYEN